MVLYESKTYSFSCYGVSENVEMPPKEIAPGQETICRQAITDFWALDFNYGD